MAVGAWLEVRPLLAAWRQIKIETTRRLHHLRGEVKSQGEGKHQQGGRNRTHGSVSFQDGRGESLRCAQSSMDKMT